MASYTEVRFDFAAKSLLESYVPNQGLSGTKCGFLRGGVLECLDSIYRSDEQDCARTLKVLHITGFTPQTPSQMNRFAFANAQDSDQLLHLQKHGDFIVGCYVFVRNPPILTDGGRNEAIEVLKMPTIWPMVQRVHRHLQMWQRNNEPIFAIIVEREATDSQPVHKIRTSVRWDSILWFFRRISKLCSLCQKDPDTFRCKRQAIAHTNPAELYVTPVEWANLPATDNMAAGSQTQNQRTPIVYTSANFAAVHSTAADCDNGYSVAQNENCTDAGVDEAVVDVCSEPTYTDVETTYRNNMNIAPSNSAVYSATVEQSSVNSADYCSAEDRDLNSGFERLQSAFYFGCRDANGFKWILLKKRCRIPYSYGQVTTAETVSKSQITADERFNGAVKYVTEELPKKPGAPSFHDSSKSIAVLHNDDKLPSFVCAVDSIRNILERQDGKTEDRCRYEFEFLAEDNLTIPMSPCLIYLIVRNFVDQIQGTGRKSTVERSQVTKAKQMPPPPGFFSPLPNPNAQNYSNPGPYQTQPPSVNQGYGNYNENPRISPAVSVGRGRGMSANAMVNRSYGPGDFNSKGYGTVPGQGPPPPPPPPPSHGGYM